MRSAGVAASSISLENLPGAARDGPANRGRTVSRSQPRSLMRDWSKLPSDLGAETKGIFVGAFDDLIGSIGAEQPRPIDRDLVANAEGVLGSCRADAENRITERLHGSQLKHELLIQIEEILQADCATISVRAGIVEFR